MQFILTSTTDVLIQQRLVGFLQYLCGHLWYIILYTYFVILVKKEEIRLMQITSFNLTVIKLIWLLEILACLHQYTIMVEIDIWNIMMTSKNILLLSLNNRMDLRMSIKIWRNKFLRHERVDLMITFKNNKIFWNLYLRRKISIIYVLMCRIKGSN